MRGEMFAQHLRRRRQQAQPDQMVCTMSKHHVRCHLQMKIVVEELSSTALNLRRKGGREHEGLPRLLGRHAGDADSAPDVWHEALVQHAVCLIQDKELDAAEGDVATLCKVEKSPRRCHQNVTASPQLRCLEVNN